MSLFHGVISALPTPFKNGKVDQASLKRLVNYQLERGIQGFVVNGTTAESPTLEWKEVEDIFRTVKGEVGSKIPLLIGTGSNSTQKTIETSVKAEALGPDGLLVVTPYYNKPPQRGLVAHFQAVAQSVHVPIMLYNVPGRTAVSLSAEATIELCKTPNIVGVKDATADLELGKKIREGTNDDFVLSSGDDFTFHELALIGGNGVISVLSNVIPAETVALLKKGISKDRSCVQDFEKFRQLTQLLFVEANPIPVKAALHLMGIFETDEMRLPLVTLDPKYKKQVSDELKKLEITG